MNGYGLSVHRRQTDISQWESQIPIPNGEKPDEPIMNRPIPLMTQKNNLSRAATVKTASPSQVVMKVRSKSDLSGMNGATWAMSAMTVKEAVEFLTHSDMHDLLFGASIIQHHTFSEEKAKQEVCNLGGIHSLIQLLKIDNSQLQQTAAAALRNVVFKHSENKAQVQQYGGLEVIVTLLQSNSITETQKQLTGLLWNLSSADDLKPELNKIGLVPLTESIVVPYTLGYDSNTNKLIDPEVFCNTTGCIRNLSCSNEEERISMRNCPGLIDSLMAYVQSQMDIGETDDKSVENCVCILHNLSFQLDKEASEHFSITDDETMQIHRAKNDNSIFSSKATKIQKELSFPAMDDLNPEGVGWLYNRKSLQLYLSLLKLSQNKDILEACCGALQNLTASKNPVSTVISQTIAEKLNGLLVISPLLNSKDPSLQKTAMSLVGNMSRVSNLRATMAKVVLPQVSSFLSSVTPDMDESDGTVATACRVMQTITLAEPEHSKKVLNRDLIMNLSLLSENMSFLTARHAAGVLLYGLWKEKDIQNTLKKQKMTKDMFVNTVTCASYRIVTGIPLR